MASENLSLKSSLPSFKNALFFDNNGTTMINAKAQQALSIWCKTANPSSDSKISEPCKKAIEICKAQIADYCNAPLDKYEIIFTSGASESNNFAIKQTAFAYKMTIKQKPHIILSAIEHHASLSAVADLKSRGDVEYTFLPVDREGFVSMEELKTAIKPNTCLISIMAANNESGVVLDVYNYAKLAYENKIPFHIDAVQVFGKAEKIDMLGNKITMLSSTSHKHYGPKGSGLLIIDKNFIQGYNIKALINGTQQNSLRGGTENVGGIVSSHVSLCETIKDRAAKNKRMFQLRSYILSEFAKQISFGRVADYYERDEEYKGSVNEMIILSPHISSKNPTSESFGFSNACLPNTIFLSIVKNVGSDFCNIKFKKELDNRGVIVSVASSCLTSSAKASHVIYALKLPKCVRRGVIRISLSDYHTNLEVKKFVKIFTETMKEFLAVK
jgi:cysteine desulfurase